MKLIKTLGIDLAKNTFSLVGMNEHDNIWGQSQRDPHEFNMFLLQATPVLAAHLTILVFVATGLT